MQRKLNVGHSTKLWVGVFSHVPIVINDDGHRHEQLDVRSFYFVLRFTIHIPKRFDKEIALRK